jgi:two-component system invasion response regulator UvrY
MAPENVQLLVADDHVIIRRGLRFIIEKTYASVKIDETDSLRGIIKCLIEKKYTHLILDMQMQDGNIIELMPTLAANYPKVQIMVYTMSPEDLYGTRMLKLGAHSFLNKQSDEAEIRNALQLFLNNKPYLSNKLSDIISAQKPKQHHDFFGNLSDRELTVLNYLLKGESLKDIATKLDLKANTVATFKARLFDKMGVSNLIDLKTLVETFHQENKNE